MLRRLGILAAAAVASLALASSAQAAPTTPQLNPLPTYVCGSKPTISWTKSTPDPRRHDRRLRVDIGDLTTGTATFKYVAGLSTQIGPLINGHHYVVRVRALQYRFGVYSFSRRRTTTSGRAACTSSSATSTSSTTRSGGTSAGSATASRTSSGTTR